jgi:hypothetical protein
VLTQARRRWAHRRSSTHQSASRQRTECWAAAPKQHQSNRLDAAANALLTQANAYRLSIALSALLITMEIIFGTIFGLLVHHLWPTLAESFGMTLLFMGVLAVIRIVYGQQALKLDGRSA